MIYFNLQIAFPVPQRKYNLPCIFIYKLLLSTGNSLSSTLSEINGSIIKHSHSTLTTSTFPSKHPFSVPPVFDRFSPRLKWPHVSFVGRFLVYFSIHPPVIAGTWFETFGKVIHITIAGDLRAVLGWLRCCFGNCRLVRTKIHVMGRGTEGV